MENGGYYPKPYTCPTCGTTSNANVCPRSECLRARDPASATREETAARRSEASRSIFLPKYFKERVYKKAPCPACGREISIAGAAWESHRRTHRTDNI